MRHFSAQTPLHRPFNYFRKLKSFFFSLLILRINCLLGSYRANNIKMIKYQKMSSNQALTEI